MSWELAGGQDAAVPTLPTRVRFKAIFDALLDSSRLGDVDAGAAGVITASAVLASGAPAINVPTTTSYNPAGVFMAGPGPSLVADPAPALPSGSSVTLALDRASITGKDGLPFQGPDTFAIVTEPFAVTVMYLEDEIARGYAIPLTFSGLPAADIAQTIKVVNASGAEVDIVVAPTDEDPASFEVEYAKEGGWPLGAYTLTIAATAADVFGVPLAAGAFSKAFAVVPETDAGDGTQVDAGAEDAEGGDI